MDENMKIDAKQIRRLREERAWSQEHLATVAGLSLRTIQRVEAAPRAVNSRYRDLINPILWATAMLASAWVTKSTLLSVIVLPALASISLTLTQRSRKRADCARRG